MNEDQKHELEVPETFEFMGMIFPTYPNKPKNK